MRLLLDTHVYLWCLLDDRKLTARVKRHIESASEVFVSSASIWEAAIKATLGKLDVDLEQMVHQIEESGFRELQVSARHAAGVRKLPLHHHDPFDRLLVAQTICESLQLLTHDRQLAKYSSLIKLTASLE